MVNEISRLIQKFNDCTDKWGTGDANCEVDEWRNEFKGELDKMMVKYGELKKFGGIGAGVQPQNIHGKRREAAEIRKRMQNKIALSDDFFNLGVGWASLFTGLFLGTVYMVSKKL